MAAPTLADPMRMPEPKPKPEPEAQQSQSTSKPKSKPEAQQSQSKPKTEPEAHQPQSKPKSKPETKPEPQRIEFTNCSPMSYVGLGCCWALSGMLEKAVSPAVVEVVIRCHEDNYSWFVPDEWSNCIANALGMLEQRPDRGLHVHVRIVGFKQPHPEGSFWEDPDEEFGFGVPDDVEGVTLSCTTEAEIADSPISPQRQCKRRRTMPA
jgi:hypothetical protein